MRSSRSVVQLLNDLGLREKYHMSDENAEEIGELTRIGAKWIWPSIDPKNEALAIVLNLPCGEVWENWPDDLNNMSTKHIIIASGVEWAVRVCTQDCQNDTDDSLRMIAALENQMAPSRADLIFLSMKLIIGSGDETVRFFIENEVNKKEGSGEDRFRSLLTQTAAGFYTPFSSLFIGMMVSSHSSLFRSTLAQLENGSNPQSDFFDYDHLLKQTEHDQWIWDVLQDSPGEKGVLRSLAGIAEAIETLRADTYRNTYEVVSSKLP